jgi:hypothetical protein
LCELITFQHVNKRRFPPPWSVEDIGAAFVVKDNGGQKLAYIHVSGMDHA